MGRSLSPGRAVSAIAAVLALTACSPAATAGDPSSAPPSASSTGTPDPGSSMRDKLAAGLRATSPVNANLVADPATKLTVQDATWLTGWQVVDVVNLAPPRPRRFFAGLSDGGEAVMLSGKPEAFAAMVSAAQVELTAGRRAIEAGNLSIDATRSFTRYAYRVESVSDIRWLPKPNADQARAIARAKADLDEIAAPEAERAADGWTLTVWEIDGRSLVRHHLAVTTAAAITDDPVVVARNLPVPESI